MGKPSLRVELDRAEYSAGDSITGHVDVTAPTAFSCEGLDVRRFWRTSGYAHSAQGGEETQRLSGGELVAGHHRFPFAFVAPQGPVTYHGTILNVEWQVEARAAVSGVDPHAEASFTLSAGGKASATADTQDGFDLASASSVMGSGTMLGCVLAVVLPLLLVGLGCAAFGIRQLVAPEAGDPGGVFFLVWGALFTWGPAGALFLFLRPRIAARRLGVVTLVVEPRVAQPGDLLRCQVSFTPRADLTIETAEVALVGNERASRSSGKSTSRQSHELARRVESLAGRRVLRAGDPVRLGVSIQVPPDAAPSFSAPGSAVHWTVNLRIALPRWPDWVDTTAVAVLPASSTR